MMVSATHDAISKTGKHATKQRIGLGTKTVRPCEGNMIVINHTPVGDLGSDDFGGYKVGRSDRILHSH